jgi:hypothetical protein
MGKGAKSAKDTGAKGSSPVSTQGINHMICFNVEILFPSSSLTDGVKYPKHVFYAFCCR